MQLSKLSKTQSYGSLMDLGFRNKCVTVNGLWTSVWPLYNFFDACKLQEHQTLHCISGYHTHSHTQITLLLWLDKSNRIPTSRLCFQRQSHKFPHCEAFSLKEGKWLKTGRFSRLTLQYYKVLHTHWTYLSLNHSFQLHTTEAFPFRLSNKDWSS